MRTVNIVHNSNFSSQLEFGKTIPMRKRKVRAKIEYLFKG